MILVYGHNTIGNIIHMIIGPDTEAWMDLHGAVTTDITPLLKMCNPDAPVLLNISRCQNEDQTIATFQGVINSGARYPFLPKTLVMAPQLAENEEGQQQNNTQPQQAGNRQKKPGSKIKGKCSRCPAEDVELVPDIKPPICYSCAQIDLYYARKDKPYGNPGE